MADLAQTARSESVLKGARRLVVKIGSALIVDPAGGEIRRPWLDALMDDIAGLRGAGVEIVIVTSGAVAIGRRVLGLDWTRSLRLEEKQAAAAVGQVRLVEAYRASLARHDVVAAQVLVTPDDTEARKRHLNARATLTTLLALGAVPVINENDTVATAELRFGDNDRLAARVAQMASADTLLLLTDVDGLYTGDPRADATARHIPEVRVLTSEIEAMAGEARPGISSGGMVTKLAAARIAMAAGCRMVIANGHGLNPLAALDRGARATWFLPAAEPLTARKRWIAAHVATHGHVTADDGAVRALTQGKSLLPTGVREISGAFERGDLVGVRALDGREIARGLVNYSADEARLIVGHHSGAFEALLGYRGREELNSSGRFGAGMKMVSIFALLVAMLSAGTGYAAPADDLAKELFAGITKPITADSLPIDFAHLAKFVRHDSGNRVLYADGGVADGHVRHAQAQFDVRHEPRDPSDKSPLFFVAFELGEDADFTFPGFAAALARLLGTPDATSNQNGAVFRTWRLKDFPGRILTVARAQASDNGEAITVVQLVQNP